MTTSNFSAATCERIGISSIKAVNAAFGHPGIEDLMALQQASGTQALQIRPCNLEDVYLKLTGRELDDNE